MNTGNNCIAQHGAQKHILCNGTTALCHVVDVIGGGDESLLVAQLASGLFVAIHKKLVIEAGTFEKQESEIICIDDARLAAWLLTEGLIVPRAFVEALQYGGLREPRAWHATFKDVLLLSDRRYTVRWRLSGEDADSQNQDVVSTVGEAFEILANEGVLQARAGNSGSVSLGSVELYSTRFSSSGVDRGDSHINPTMQTRQERLLEVIEAYERGLQDGRELERTPHVVD